MSAAAKGLSRGAVWMTCVALWLTACGGGVDSGTTSGSGAVVQYTVGGSVQGLTGSGLSLVNNGSDPINIAADGTFTFATPLVPGDAYNITISSQPNTPSQTCSVNNGSGTVTTGNVANLSLNCVNKTTTTDVIGGTVEGVMGSGLVLQDNLGDDLNITTNGEFTFATPLASGAAYAVSVLSPPITPYQDCVIVNGAGTTGANDVLNIAITCRTNLSPTYTIGGSVSGLVAGTTLALLDNGRDATTISANGAFTFALPIPSGSSYTVTSSGASSQQSQACAISNANGTVTSAAITNVSVVCTQNAYVIATVSGLPPGFALQLQDNGADTLTISKDGTYPFATAVPTGSSYAVTISQQPPYTTGQTCVVTNPTGTAAAGNNAVTVTCPPPVLASIQVTPAASNTALGVNPQFTATGILSDNSAQNLTTQVTWTSSNLSVATISNAAGTNGASNTVGMGTTTITATSGGVAGSATLTVTPATLTAIQITPAVISVAKGNTAPFVATGIYSDHSTHALTNQVTWASSVAATASISNTAGSNGVATTLGVGVTTISASSGTITANAPLTVTAATLVSIGVTPANVSVASGLSQQFAATGVYSDNSTQVLTSQVTWSATTTTPVTVPPTVVATISNLAGSQGLATTSSPGVVTITATSGAVTGSTTLNVTGAILESISVTPATPSVPAGSTQQFTATGSYSDNSTLVLTTQVTWSATTTAPAGVGANYAATISNAQGSKGLAIATAAGTVQIAAALGGVTAAATLTVTPAVLRSIQVTPAVQDIIEVAAVRPNVAAGFSQQFIATGTYSDNSTLIITTQVTWSATTVTPAGVPLNYVATISNAPGSQGLVTATAAGTANIEATSGTIVGSTLLTVSTALLESIEVLPENSSIPNLTAEQFTATGIYSDGSTSDLTTQVTWSIPFIPGIANPASISNAPGSQGLATAQAQGQTTVTGTLGGISGTTNLTVVQALLTSIAVSPPGRTFVCYTTNADNGSQQYTATGTYADGSTGPVMNVTWTSSETGVAVINSSGLASAIGPGPNAIEGEGTSTITATSGSISGAATFVSYDCTIR